DPPVRISNKAQHGASSASRHSINNKRDQQFTTANHARAARRSGTPIICIRRSSRPDIAGEQSLGIRQRLLALLHSALNDVTDLGVAWRPPAIDAGAPLRNLAASRTDRPGRKMA